MSSERTLIALTLAAFPAAAPAQGWIADLPDYREQLERQGLEPRTSTPDEFAVFLRAEYDKWGKVIGALKRQDTFSRWITGRATRCAPNCGGSTSCTPGSCGVSG